MGTHRRRGVVAFSAFAGAAGLAFGRLSMGAEIDARLPFESTTLGGVALAVIVGVPFSVLAIWAWLGDPRTGAAAVIVGAILIGWLVVEPVFIRELSFFHPLYALVAIAFAVAGWRQLRAQTH